MSDDDVLARLPAVPEIEIEIPLGSFLKRRSDGSVDFLSPLPCPYNYGCIPGLVSPDGDPLDAIVFGPRRTAGSRVSVPVVAVLDFRDRDAFDPKVICSARPLSGSDRAGLTAFFRTYSVLKRALALARGQEGDTRFVGFLPESRWRSPS